MVGYIRKGTTRQNTFTGSVEFEIESVSGVADNLWQIAGGLETYLVGENALAGTC